MIWFSLIPINTVLGYMHFYKWFCFCLRKLQAWIQVILIFRKCEETRWSFLPLSTKTSIVFGLFSFLAGKFEGKCVNNYPLQKVPPMRKHSLLILILILHKYGNSWRVILQHSSIIHSTSEMHTVKHSERSKQYENCNKLSTNQGQHPVCGVSYNAASYLVVFSS